MINPFCVVAYIVEDDILEWCRDRNMIYNWIYLGPMYGVKISFNDTNDMLAYKLKWDNKKTSYYT